MKIWKIAVLSFLAVFVVFPIVAGLALWIWSGIVGG
jgi:hypothetical protein